MLNRTLGKNRRRSTGLGLLIVLVTHAVLACQTYGGIIGQTYNLEDPDWAIGEARRNFIAWFQHTNVGHSDLDVFLTTPNKKDGDALVTAFNGFEEDTSNPQAFFNGAGKKTHTIKLSDIPLTTDNKLRVFLLDVNQIGKGDEADDHIVISNIKVYTSSNGSISNPSNLPAPIYDMNLDDFVISVQVDGSFGNGKADMNFYLPNDLFTLPNTPDPFVYLQYSYSNNNDGQETWMLSNGSTYTNPGVPEPASLAFWATGGLVGLVYRTRRKAGCSTH